LWSIPCLEITIFISESKRNGIGGGVEIVEYKSITTVVALGRGVRVPGIQHSMVLCRHGAAQHAFLG